MKFFYFSSSHWDREWYQTFQGFRKRLVEVARGLCETLENDPSFGTFHFDGQTVVLEDIAEVDPNTEKRLRELIETRRVLIGPWYVMPDEFLISGESMIKNLQIGHNICADYGTESWKFGYVCDIFGHIAQMPQIFKGFGIEHALLGRGTNESTTAPFFRWRGPDGTEARVVRISDYYGYGDFNMSVFGFDDSVIDEATFREKAKTYIDTKIDSHPIPITVLMDGIDHAPVHRRIPQFLSWLREMYPKHEFFHTDLVEAGIVVDQFRDQLQVKEGELIEPAEAQAPFLHLITNTLSSYYPLKRWNDRCQAQLERVVAPLMVERSRSNASDLFGFVELAWRYLIKNHPHDSIGGCSLDQVHRDMEYRFAQCSQLIQEVIDDELNRTKVLLDKDQRRLTVIAEEALDTATEYAHHVYNPLPFKRDEALDLEIELPKGYAARQAEPFGYQSLPSFLLIDGDGNELPYAIVEHKPSHLKRVYNQFVRTIEVVTINVRVVLQAMSWTTIRIVPSNQPVRYFQSLQRGMYHAETELLGLFIEKDGTISVQDRGNDRIYPGLNRFAVDREIGDGWYHAAPVGNETAFTSAGTLAGITLLRDTPQETRFRITHTVEIPDALEWRGTLQEEYGGITQSNTSTMIKIESEIGVRAGSNQIDYTVRVDTKAKDVRLRVLVPTGIRGDYFAHQTFAVLTRPTGRIWGEKTARWKESEPVEKNFSGFVGKRDADGRGIAIIAPWGLHEVAGLDDDDGTLAITLLRAFRRTVMTNGETKGQLPGSHTFTLGLRPFDGTTSYGSLHRDYLFQSTDVLSQTLPTSPRILREQSPALEIESVDITYSTYTTEETSGDNAVLRLCNYSDQEAAALIRIRDSLESIEPIDFLGNVDEGHSVKLDGPNRATVTIGAWKIATYRLTFTDG